MHARRSHGGDMWFVHFEPGVELHEAYRRFAREHDVDAGAVLNGIGMVKDPVLGFYDGEKYHRERLEGAFELVSTQGNIALFEGKPFTHLHATIAGADHAVRGGHLFEAEVHVAHEGTVRAFGDLALRRAKVPGTELAGLTW